MTAESNQPRKARATKKKPPKTVGYVRVSTPEQRHDRQMRRIRGECDEIHVETVSATGKRRPVFEAAMNSLRVGDTFVVLDLDRAFRSGLDALQTLQDLRARGVHFRILNAPLDLASDYGELHYGFMALMAQHERKIISRRTKEGLAAARARGVRLGRKPKLTAEQTRALIRLVEHGRFSIAEAGAHFGLKRSTAWRIVKRGRREIRKAA